MMRETSSISLPKSSGCPRTIRTKAVIYKVQRKVEKSNVSSGKLALELSIAWRSVCQEIDQDSQEYITWRPSFRTHVPRTS